MAMKRAEQSADTAPADEAALAVMDESSEQRAVARTSVDSTALGSFEGDLNDVGAVLPYLQISHAQGRLEAFRKGSVVLGTDNLIANPGDKIYVTVLAACVYWKEYTSGDQYDPAYIPKAFRSKEEVIASGGSIVWKDNVAPTYKTALATKVLVRQPKDIVCGLFGIRIGEYDYAAARWNTDKSAAASVAPVLKADTMFSLRKRGLYSGVYELTTQQVKFPSGFSAYVPRIKLVGFHTDEEIKQILDLFRADTSAPVEIQDV